jgi:hypothetical protein
MVVGFGSRKITAFLDPRVASFTIECPFRSDDGRREYFKIAHRPSCYLSGHFTHGHFLATQFNIRNLDSEMENANTIRHEVKRTLECYFAKPLASFRTTETEDEAKA